MKSNKHEDDVRPVEDLEELEEEIAGEQDDERQTVSLPSGGRLDIELSTALDKSRSFVQNLIGDQRVWVNGQNKKSNYKLRDGDKVEIVLPDLSPPVAEPEDIKLDIIYEDQDLLVVNKPQGMVVHPAPGAWHGTLVNALLFYCTDLSGINGILRPGIVHRIDKDTSGLLVVAKNDEAHVGLAEQIKAHTMTRCYKAIVYGEIKEPSGTVEGPIGRDPAERKRMAVTFRNAKPATTHYTVLSRSPGYTYLEARLETGRTHQIRVHMAYLGHSVLGDPLYGPRRPALVLPGQMLHAAQLGFRHPRSGDYLEFEVPVPPLFSEVLESLGFLTGQ